MYSAQSASVYRRIFISLTAFCILFLFVKRSFALEPIPPEIRVDCTGEEELFGGGYDGSKPLLWRDDAGVIFSEIHKICGDQILDLEAEFEGLLAHYLAEFEDLETSDLIIEPFSESAVESRIQEAGSCRVYDYQVVGKWLVGFTNTRSTCMPGSMLANREFVLTGFDFLALLAPRLVFLLFAFWLFRLLSQRKNMHQ